MLETVKILLHRDRTYTAEQVESLIYNVNKANMHSLFGVQFEVLYPSSIEYPNLALRPPKRERARKSVQPNINSMMGVRPSLDEVLRPI